MFNPDIELRIARQRHGDMVKYAERQRLYEQLPQSRPNRLEQLNHRLSHALGYLKAQARPKPPVALFGKR
jgi:hypothetical protein